MHETDIEWTGERMVDYALLSKGMLEHLHRYALSLAYVEGKVVLDIACGEGYGSNILSEQAKKVYGIDISDDTIKHAAKKYRKNNIEFIKGSVLDIPLNNNSVDVIISFETIEHLVEQEEMLKEFKRVLHPNGVLIISSPEKVLYTGNDHQNPFHLKELTLNEFESLLKSQFSFVKIGLQRFLFSSQFSWLNEPDENEIEYSGSFKGVIESSSADDQYFNIAICSNSTGTIRFNPSVFNGNSLFKEMEIRFSDALSQLSYEKVLKQRILDSTTHKVGSILLYPFKKIKDFLKR